MAAQGDKIYSEIRRARTAGEVIPYFNPQANIRKDGSASSGASLVLPDRLYARLNQYAHARGMTVGEAVTSLLEAGLLPNAVQHG